MAKLVQPFGTDFKTPIGQLRFPAIARAEAYKDSKPRFGATLVLPESAKVKELVKAVEELAVLNFGKEASTVLKPYVTGIEYTDNMTDPSDNVKNFFKDKIVFKANSNLDHPPKCVLQNGNVIDRIPGDETCLDVIEETFYPGSLVRLALTPLAYQMSKQLKGVTFLFKGVQFFADGQRLGGTDVAKIFADDFDTEGIDAFTVDNDSGLPDVDGVNI